MLPPELLARIPPPGNPDVTSITTTSPTTQTTSSNNISTVVIPLSAAPSNNLKRTVSRANNQSQNWTKERLIKVNQPPLESVSAPKVRKLLSSSSLGSPQVVLPFRPPLLQKPEMVGLKQTPVIYHPSPPPLTPCCQTLSTLLNTRPSPSSLPKGLTLKKALSADNVESIADWSVPEQNLSVGSFLDNISQQKEIFPLSWTEENIQGVPSVENRLVTNCRRQLGVHQQ